ncbi:MAG: ADP-ribosylglycohydrolase family protein [Planctomycetes bacterium]|nr:ADP-ribosylglycohydrolase family protein [Planctomycetota bacterium]
MQSPCDADAAIGCFLGLAIGDALGVPREGMSARRGERLFPNLDRHHFFFGRGLFSDDTEHACMTAQALLVSGGDIERFTRSLGSRIRWWFAGLPAGIGHATVKASLKLWCGFSPNSSGVFSAGNGPAMRSPILGLVFGNDREKLREFVRASTRITHTDPKADCGALVAAWAVHRAVDTRHGSPPTAAEFVAELRELLAGEESAEPLLTSLDLMVQHLEAGRTVAEYAAALGLKHGVSGYIYHTVPVAVYAWLRHPDEYRAAVQATIRCGGDTDTVAAIAGAIVGARVGKVGIPPELLSGIIDWPRSVRWVESLAARLAEGKWRDSPQRALPLAVWALPLRNAIFFVWVLLHAARRLLPPY